MLDRFVPAFERIVGRTPSPEESKEALAIADVVASSDLDPILLFYLADRRAQEARERIPAEARAAIASALKDLRVNERMPSCQSRPERAPWRDLGLYAGGLASAVAVAWAASLLIPRFGALGLSYGVATALVTSALVALWREAPRAHGPPTREIVSFAAGLAAAVAIAAVMNVSHDAPVPMRFAIVASAGVAIGLLWRTRVGADPRD